MGRTFVYFRTRAQGEVGSTGTGKHGHRSKGAVGGEVRVMSEECIETLRDVASGHEAGRL